MLTYEHSLFSFDTFHRFTDSKHMAESPTTTSELLTQHDGIWKLMSLSETAAAELQGMVKVINHSVIGRGWVLFLWLGTVASHVQRSQAGMRVLRRLRV